jgi:hypothetical protein
VQAHWNASAELWHPRKRRSVNGRLKFDEYSKTGQEAGTKRQPETIGQAETIGQTKSLEASHKGLERARLSELRKKPMNASSNVNAASKPERLQ